MGRNRKRSSDSGNGMKNNQKLTRNKVEAGEQRVAEGREMTEDSLLEEVLKVKRLELMRNSQEVQDFLRQAQAKVAARCQEQVRKNLEEEKRLDEEAKNCQVLIPEEATTGPGTSDDQISDHKEHLSSAGDVKMKFSPCNTSPAALNYPPSMSTSYSPSSPELKAEVHTSSFEDSSSPMVSHEAVKTEESSPQKAAAIASVSTAYPSPFQLVSLSGADTTSGVQLQVSAMGGLDAVSQIFRIGTQDFKVLEVIPSASSTNNSSQVLLAPIETSAGLGTLPICASISHAETAAVSSVIMTECAGTMVSMDVSSHVSGTTIAENPPQYVLSSAPQLPQAPSVRALMSTAQTVRTAASKENPTKVNVNHYPILASELQFGASGKSGAGSDNSTGESAAAKQEKPN